MVEKSNRQYIEEIKLLRRQMADIDKEKIECQETIEKLTENEKIYRILADNDPNWTFWLNADDRLIYISPSCRRITGYEPEDFQKDTKLMVKLIHPNDRTAFDEHLHFAQKSQSPTEEEFRIIRKDKKTRWISYFTQPVYDANGQYAGILASNRDVTDTKNLDSGSQESEILYRLLADNMNDVIWTTDTTFQMTYISPSISKLRGYTEEEAMEQNLREALTSSSFKKFNEVWSAELAQERPGKASQNRPLILELEFQCKDGSTVWTESKITPLRNKDKKVVEILGVSQDIMELKQTQEYLIACEQQIRQSENPLKALLNASTESIIQLDIDTRILYANEAAARLLGTDRDTLLGKGDLNDFIPAEMGVKFRQYILQARKTNKPVHFEDDFLGRTVSNSIYPIVGEDGKVIQLAVSSRDVTDYKSAESADQESRRKLAETERLLNLIIEAIPAGVYWKDQRSVYLGGNRLFARDAGFDRPEELIGEVDQNMVWHEQADRIREDDLAVMDEGRSKINWEELQTTADGKQVWLRTTRVPLTDSDGQTIGVVGTYEDITEQKITAERLMAGKIKLHETENLLQQTESLLRKTEAQFQENQNRLREAENKVIQDENQLQQIKNRLREAETQFQESQNQLREAENKLNREENQLQQIENRLQETEALLQESQNQLREAENKLNRDKNQLRQIESRLTEGESHILQSENQLRALLNVATECIFLMDTDGKVLLANEMTARRLNTDLPTLLAGRSVYDFIPQQVGEKRRKYISDVQKTGQPARFEDELFGKTIFNSIFPITGEDGKVSRVAVFSMDITDRKTAEAAIQESRRHKAEAKRMLHLVINTIPARIFWKDQNSVYMGSNLLFARDAGKDNPESLIGETDQTLPWRKEAKLYIQDDCEVMASGKPKINYEVPQTTPDGQLVWFRTTKVPLTDSDGRIVGVLGTYDDITEQKKSAEALAESERRYQNLFENHHMAVLIVDPESGAIVNANNAAAAYTGWSQEELIFKKISDLMTISEREMAKQMKLAVAQKRNYFIFKHKKADSSIRDVEVFTGHLHFQDRLFLYVMIYDITDRNQIEQVSQQPEKLDSLGILAGGIAHDFNNLMTIVQGNIDVALLSLPEDDTTCQSLQAAQEAVEKTRDITSRLIAFSQGGTPMVKVCRIEKLLSNASKSSLQSSPVELSLTIQDDLWPAEVDQNQIKQCFCNLVDNAAEAMPEIGTLTIRAENAYITEADALPLTEGPYLKIAFQDNGGGISGEHIARIFDPYFSTKPMSKDKGLGLGLAVCHAILKKHGGYITVNSEEGKGATFSLYLPAKPGAVVEEEPAVVESAPPPKRILIMDDNEEIRKILQLYLEKLGFDVIGVTNGQEVIRNYKEAQEADEAFAAVFMELSVKQGLGGEAALPRLKDIDPDIKAVAILSEQGQSRIEDFLDRGFENVLGKPFRFEDMKKIIKSLFES